MHPFHIGEEQDFNPWFYVIGMVILFYGMLGWQGAAGYNSAPRNAHEAKMANILAGWRFRVLMLITIIVPVCVHVFFQHADFATQAAAVNQQLAHVPVDEQSSRRAPLMLAAILPAGMLGLFVATQPVAGLPAGLRYLSPAQLAHPGELYTLERLPKFTRNGAVRQVFEYVLPF